MCQNVNVFPETVNVVYKDGFVYVQMKDYLDVIGENVLLKQTLKDVCKRGISVEARSLCALNDEFVEAAQSLLP